MAITNLTELNQGIANLEQRFTVPPKFLTKEDFVQLVTFLADTERFLYFNYEKAYIVRDNITSIKTVANNIDDVKSIANDINVINNVNDNLEELTSIYNSLAKMLRIYQSISAIDTIIDSIQTIDVLYSNITGILSIYNNLAELLQVDNNAQVAIDKAAEASYHSDQAALRVQQKFDSFIQLTGVKNNDILLHNGTKFENVSKEQLSDGGNF